eukprot:g4507.t1
MSDCLLLTAFGRALPLPPVSLSLVPWLALSVDYDFVTSVRSNCHYKNHLKNLKSRRIKVKPLCTGSSDAALEQSTAAMIQSRVRAQKKQPHRHVLEALRIICKLGCLSWFRNVSTHGIWLLFQLCSVFFRNLRRCLHLLPAKSPAPMLTCPLPAEGAGATRLPPHTQAISFSGCSWLLFFHVGAYRALLECSDFVARRGQLHFMGSSCGALMAAALCTGVSLQALLDLSQTLVTEAHSHVFGAAGRMTHIVETGLRALLPWDAHKQATGRLHVSVTVLTPWPHNLIVSRFETREKLIATLLASCYIPLYYERPCRLQAGRPFCASGKDTQEAGEESGEDTKEMKRQMMDHNEPFAYPTAKGNTCNKTALPTSKSDSFGEDGRNGWGLVAMDGGLTNNLPTFSQLDMSAASTKGKASQAVADTVTISPYAGPGVTVAPKSPFPSHLSRQPGAWQDCLHIMEHGYHAARTALRVGSCSPDAHPGSVAVPGVVLSCISVTDAEDSCFCESYGRLLRELTTSKPAPTQDALRALAITSNRATLHTDTGAIVFIAKKEDASRPGIGQDLLGTASLTFATVPTGKKAWIEDVVVFSTARGCGIGSRLVEACLAVARQIGCGNVDLTSNPARIEAHALYKKLGFAVRDTLVFRRAMFVTSDIHCRPPPGGPSLPVTAVQSEQWQLWSGQASAPSIRLRAPRQNKYNNL